MYIDNLHIKDTISSLINRESATVQLGIQFRITANCQ